MGSHSALIHDYYARETKDPIHLTLDTTLTSGRVTMKAYVFVPLGVPGATSGSMFTPVQVELVASEPEIAGLDLLNKTKFSKVRTVEPMPELTKVADAAEKMQVMLDAVIQYVEAVLDGPLPLPNDQDPAAVEREALHGLCQQSEGGGQASTSRGALNISQVVPSQFFKIEDHKTTTTILAIL